MKKTIFVNWSFEVAFSVYAALLIGWAEESRPNAWSTSGRYLYFWHPHAPALGQSDFVLFYLELLLGLTAVVFVSLKLIELLSRRSAVLLTGGVLSIAGIPLVLLYSARGHSLPILIELVIASVCTVLWMCRKWPVSTFFTIVLLTLHFAFCFAFALTFGFIRMPPDSTNMIQSIWFLIPVLGCFFALLWGNRFRRSQFAG